jgi:hypothetical protein
MTVVMLSLSIYMKPKIWPRQHKIKLERNECENTMKETNSMQQYYVGKLKHITSTMIRIEWFGTFKIICLTVTLKCGEFHTYKIVI